ncbi:wax ester/triacylglycerol synthase family O-acyltransferase [Intrasporangium mesophilum]
MERVRVGRASGDERLGSEDKVMLWPEARWPQHVSALLILDGAPLLADGGRLRLDALRRHVDQRLDLVPRLRQRLAVPGPGRGGPRWVQDARFAVERHVDAVGVPPPGDTAALLAVVEQLRRRPLDHGKPLWDLCFLTGLADGQVGLLARLHHVVADGMAGMATLSALLDAEVRAPDGGVLTEPTGTAQHPDFRRPPMSAVGPPAGGAGTSPSIPRGAGSRRPADVARPFLRLLAGPHPARTSLDRVVGPDRTLAVVRVPLEPVRETARAHGATVNDVLLTSTAGALRRLLLARGEPTPRLPCYVPATLRREDDREGARGNLLTQLVVPLPLGVEDPAYRLREISLASAAARHAPHPPLGALVGNPVGRRLLLALLDRNPVSVTTADIVGPGAPRWFAGARITDVFPLLPLIGSVTVGVGAVSYAGRLDIMLVADADACPDLVVAAEGLGQDLARLGIDVLPD